MAIKYEVCSGVALAAGLALVFVNNYRFHRALFLWLYDTFFVFYINNKISFFILFICLNTVVQYKSNLKFTLDAKVAWKIYLAVSDNDKYFLFGTFNVFL